MGPHVELGELRGKMVFQTGKKIQDLHRRFYRLSRSPQMDRERTGGCGDRQNSTCLPFPFPSPRSSSKLNHYLFLAASWSFLMSSFTIFSIALITRSFFLGSLLVTNSPRMAGTTCQDTPNLSSSHPH